jgi:hypothetical protein
MYSNIPTQDVISIILDIANREGIHRDTIKETELITNSLEDEPFQAKFSILSTI